MDRGKRLALLWPEWGSIPIPSDSLSEMQLIAYIMRQYPAEPFSKVSYSEGV
jgi:hypothetical protein